MHARYCRGSKREARSTDAPVARRSGLALLSSVLYRLQGRLLPPHIKMVAPSIKRPFTSLVLGLQASATRNALEAAVLYAQHCARKGIYAGDPPVHRLPPPAASGRRHHRALNLKRHHHPTCAVGGWRPQALCLSWTLRDGLRASLSQAHATRSIITRQRLL